MHSPRLAHDGSRVLVVFVLLFVCQVLLARVRPLLLALPRPCRRSGRLMPRLPPSSPDRVPGRVGPSAFSCRRFAGRCGATFSAFHYVLSARLPA